MFPVFQTSYPELPPPIKIKNFAGINQSATPTQIGDNESPDLLNIQLDERGAMDKRPGYARIFPTSLGAGKINGIYQFKKIDGSKVFLIHHGTKLYTQSGSNQPVSIYSGMANSQSRTFMFGNKMYILDGTNYLAYDGSSVVDVSTIAYVPTLFISKTPAGGGTAYEQFNLLTPLFKESFSGDGSAKDFQLSIANIDAAAVIAWVDGIQRTETTDFTVNRTTGRVTFTVAPLTGTPNNVIIQASKTISGKANQIKQCRFITIYGGTNDTRVFFSGNPNFVNWMWRTGVSDPTYLPENQYQKVGSDASAITGFAKQYSSLLIFKEPIPNDVVVWSANYQLGSDGITVSFPIVPLNGEIGCSAPDSIQLIENTPTYLNASKGVYLIVGSNVRDERNVQHISDNIDRSLLNDSNLSKAVSIDFDKKYILVVGSNAYVFDYRQQVWYLWNNIPASCFLEMDNALYFGSNSTGLVYKFSRSKKVNGEIIATTFNDDGAAIRAYWESKVFSFNDDEHLKMVEKVFFSLKPSSATSADLYYVTDRTDKAFVVSARNDTFDFTTLNFAHFSFVLSSLPQEIAAKIKAKKIIYFQLIFENKNVDESLGILSIGIKLHTQREVK